MSKEITRLQLKILMDKIVRRNNELTEYLSTLIRLALYLYVDTKDLEPLTEAVELVRKVYGSTKCREVVALVLSQNESLRYDFKAKAFLERNKGNGHV